jgi:peptidoglycan/LPS O-acetylase OafA/YrhL
MRSTSTAWVMSAAIGLAVVLAISFATGRAEAWDHQSYWSIGYPVFAASALVLGWVFPERPWRWVMTMVGVQAFPLLTSGSDHSLAPLGALLLLLLSVPLWILAQVASVLRRRRR